MNDRPRINISTLPDRTLSDIEFHDTSFFKQRNPLPPPPAVIFKSQNASSAVVRFEKLNRAVKFGPSEWVDLSEAQTMIAVRQAFPNGEIPVPEVFGWKQHQGRNFIYMSLVRSQTLREAWPSLGTVDRRAICMDLKGIVKSLRLVTHDGIQECMIGSICGGVLQDRFFKLDYQKGPFLSIRSFNDWCLAAATRQVPGPDGEILSDGCYRPYIPDEGEVFLTHGDLTLGNIIISDGPEPRRVAGIIDWEQAGWYPAYWENFKLMCGVEYMHEWREGGWADLVMTPLNDDVFDAIGMYFSWRQP